MAIEIATANAIARPASITPRGVASWRVSRLADPVRRTTSSRRTAKKGYSDDQWAQATRSAVGDGEEVGACSKQARLGLDPANGGQDVLAAGRVGEPLLDVGQQPGRPLDGEHGMQAEARLADFLAEFLGQVEAGGGEPLRPPARVAVLAVTQGLLDMPVQRVDQVDLVAIGGQGQGLDPGGYRRGRVAMW
jgi:hypothetical protein